MAFDNSFTAVTGATYTAAQYNTHVKGNFTSIWVGTTAGDLDYYTSATAKSRLAIGAAGTFLGSNGSAPVWSGVKGLHAVTSKTWDGPDTFTSTSFASITAASNLVTTKTCTIIAVVSGVFAVGTAGWRGFVRLNIGGVAFKEVHTSNPYYVPYTAINIRTGVSAGTIAILPQARVNAGGESLTTERGGLFALAFEE